MSEEINNILKYKQGEKADKIPFNVNTDIEPLLIEKINACHNNSQKSATSKLSKHTTCGYSLFPRCSFDSNKSKHSLER